jgi:hypothetical protein
MEDLINVKKDIVIPKVTKAKDGLKSYLTLSFLRNSIFHTFAQEAVVIFSIMRFDGFIA